MSKRFTDSVMYDVNENESNDKSYFYNLPRVSGNIVVNLPLPTDYLKPTASQQIT